MSNFHLDTKRRCGFFLDVFGLTLPEYLECDLFPENSNSDECVGHQEVLDAARRAEKPGKSSSYPQFSSIANHISLHFLNFLADVRSKMNSTRTERERGRERVIRNYNFARWQEFWSRKFDKIIWIETNRIESFVPRYFSSFLAAIYSGSIERISPEDKVRAFDKEVDNRGIKIISQGQADDGWEYRRIPIKRSEDFSSPRFFNLPSLPLLVLIKIK